MSGAPALVEVERLTCTFPARTGLFGRARRLLAVDDVSFSIAAGETLAVVGESGSGKSTLGRAVLKLTRPDSGRVVVDGADLAALEGAALRRFRRKMQMIFQDPYGSLDPRMTVEDTVGEGIAIHALASSRAERRTQVAALLRRVGLAEDVATRHPHALSGGQRQRVGIARALAVKPRFIVADEPVSALDVSIQAQIINLLADLRDAEGLTFLFISHDLRIVRHLADRVAVLYFGRLVELAPVADLYARPLHPYTVALLSAEPVPGCSERRARVVLGGEPPSPLDPPTGCPFYPRCPVPNKPSACTTERPMLREPAPGHLVACHVAESQ